ncbi:hypothetical protein [Paenibacillus sp. FSL K6-2524]
MKKKNGNTPYSVVSMFSGYGGMDLGFHKAEYKKAILECIKTSL